MSINHQSENISIVQNGFQKTKIGIIPNDWELKKLSSIVVSCVGGGTPSTLRKEYWEGDLPWISSSNLSEQGISEIKATRFITKNAVMNSATNKVEKGSIVVVTRVGLGKIGISNYEELYTSQDFNSILLNQSTDPSFVAYHIKKDILKGQNQGSTIKGITKKDLLGIYIPLPPLHEQQRISEILSTQDEVIALKEKLLEEKKKQKKYLMQVLLNPDHPDFTRLEGFHDDWEKVKFGDLGKHYGGLNGKTKTDFGSGKPYVSYLDVFRKPIIRTNLFNLVNIELCENQNRIKIWRYILYCLI